MRAFSIFGDSVSTYEGYASGENAVYYAGELRETTGVVQVEDTWWMRVIRHFGGRLAANGSYSGSMVEGAGFPAASSAQRVAQIVDAQGRSPDVVLVFMGINDYGWGGAQAQAEGRSSAVPLCIDLDTVPERVAGAADGRALDNFASSYSSMLAKIRASYPHADVWCMTLVPGRACEFDHAAFCYALRGIELDAYNDAIRAAACANDCKVADIRAYGFDYEASDGTHPTKRGMEQLASMVIAAMEGADEPASPSLLASMRSERLCNESTCIGCAHARNTGNQWSCVCER